jgi:inner membrane protein
MNNLPGDIAHSSLGKITVIAVLVLVMLIPMAMTRGVIADRQTINELARQDIMQSWGSRQLIGGPVLVVPYRVVRVNPYGDRFEDEGEAYFLPQVLSIDVELVPEIRYRGIHEIPVYTARTILSGTFSAIDKTGLAMDGADFDPAAAYFALPVSDARAIRNTPSILAGNVRTSFTAGGARVPGFPTQIVAAAGPALEGSGGDSTINFAVDVDISGTEQLRFLPLGDSTEVTMRSDWAEPSFSGAYLPETREITQDGFIATWRVSSLGRELPSRWRRATYENDSVTNSAFGVDLFQPIGLYQLADRATKYAVLFIGLTFIACFLFEVLIGVRLHPLQYLLVGFANTLFYLLLLSLAEHIGFRWSYLVSALASAGLIATYSASILGGWERATLIAAMLVCLYGFLYLTLNAQSYAMLAGSVGLWLSLGLIMYLTRRIDWYRWSKVEAASNQQADLFARTHG